MSKIVKLNFTKKVRYIFDKETEENIQLGDKVADHFGSFINNSWEMSDVKRFHKALRECGLSVEEFLAKTWEPPKKKAPTKRTAPTKKKAVAKKKAVVKKTPVKKTVRKKKA